MPQPGFESVTLESLAWRHNPHDYQAGSNPKEKKN